MRTLRHITSINDLSTEEIEGIFARADFYLKKFGDKKTPYRIARSLNELPGAILAGLFYEPSTRTRLSFESAMLRLGGNAMASADPRTSSASKGESLADTVRVTSSYADLLVVRHPRDGAARLAASYAPVPVINGGDGSHEHPTQTLLDLFTLRRKKKALRNLNVAISGDLKASRTIHSFVYALARFGANIVLKPAPGMELPDDVAWRLANEFHRQRTNDTETGEVWYVAPGKQARRQSIDAVYVTRFQSERWPNAAGAYPTVNAEFLRKKEFRTTAVMHPLPRVNELDLSFDQDRRAAYFEQAAYGVPIRMAIISALLASRGKQALKRYPAGFPAQAEPLDERAISAISCINDNCIVHDPVDGPFALRKFHLVGSEPPRLRCFYCESDIDGFWISDSKSKTIFANDEPPFDWSRKRSTDLRFYGKLDHAAGSGFPRRSAEPEISPLKRPADSRS